MISKPGSRILSRDSLSRDGCLARRPSVVLPDVRADEIGGRCRDGDWFGGWKETRNTHWPYLPKHSWFCLWPDGLLGQSSNFKLSNPAVIISRSNLEPPYADKMSPRIITASLPGFPHLASALLQLDQNQCPLSALNFPLSLSMATTYLYRPSEPAPNKLSRPASCFTWLIR